MKYVTGDKVVHDVYGLGTIQVAGINGEISGNNQRYTKGILTKFAKCYNI